MPTIVNVLPFGHETSFSLLAWLFTVTVGAFFAMNVGYAVYMEDFDGAQEGIIEVEPSPYEIR